MKHLAEPLKHVKTIITHAKTATVACPDGIAAAMILRDVLPDAEVRFVEYDSEAHKRLEPDFGQLFCDITPVADRAADFVAAGAIVLDHHDGQRDIVAMFGERGVYADNATDDDRFASGAMLAHRARRVLLDADPRMIEGSQEFIANVAREERIARFAFTAGVRDTWRTEHEDWSLASDQSAALTFFPTGYWLERTDMFDATLDTRLGVGPWLAKKFESETERHIREGMLFKTRWGTRVAIVATDITSDIGESLRRQKAPVDVLIGFRYFVDADLPKIKLSSRSVSDRHVLPFVQFYGGGGHERAAGVTIVLADSDANPYKAIQQLYNRYEERL